jgi:hypothetical protein
MKFATTVTIHDARGCARTCPDAMHGGTSPIGTSGQVDEHEVLIVSRACATDTCNGEIVHRRVVLTRGTPRIGKGKAPCRSV